MEKSATCLWLDDNAKELVEFYSSTFKNVKVGDTTYIGESAAKHSGRPVGTELGISFVLENREFLVINGGPMFKPNPTISFTINCDDDAEIEALFIKLSEGGMVMMPLASYPFAEKFGWVADKFGVSWQLNLSKREQKIVPSLMFCKDQFGKCEEAINFYVSQFPNSKVVSITKYGANDEFGQEGTVKHAIFSLNGEEFMAIDAMGAHEFSFSEGTSFMVFGANQDEIDLYWNKLSHDGHGQCGWVKDKFGLSWQIVPTVLNGMLVANGGEKAEQVMAAVMKMDKLDIEALNKAFAEPAGAK